MQGIFICPSDSACYVHTVKATSWSNTCFVLFYFVLDDKLLKIRNMSFRGSISRAFENTLCKYVLNENQAMTSIIVSFVQGLYFLLFGRKFCQILWSFLKTYFSSEYLLKLDPNGSNFSVLQLKISFLCDIYHMWCVNKGKWVNRNFEAKKRTYCIIFYLTGGELL